MRTNIEIDDELMAQALAAGPFTTKKDAVEAGLKLLARQAAYREILKWEGRLRWEGDEAIDWTEAPATGGAALALAEPSAPTYAPTDATARGGPAAKAARPVKGTGRGRR
jgi:Arc/MetJ family transcription regulator